MGKELWIRQVSCSLIGFFELFFFFSETDGWPPAKITAKKG